MRKRRKRKKRGGAARETDPRTENQSAEVPQSCILEAPDPTTGSLCMDRGTEG